MTQIISKTSMMEIVASGNARESFNHTEMGIFDVTGMRDMMHNTPELGSFVYVSVADVAQFIKVSRVIDYDRVAVLTEDEAVNDPAIAILIPEPDGSVSHMFIDGTHRCIKLDQLGYKEQRIFLVDLDKALRPKAGWSENVGLDWGDAIVDGKIVKR